MSIQNVFDINVDLKQSTVIKTPIITKNDTVVFNVHVYDDGKVFDISEGKTFSIFSKRPDGQVIGKAGTVTGQNTIKFPLGTSETSVPGVVSATIQINDENGRVSTFPFCYQVLDDPSIGYVKSATEVTLLQNLISKTQDVIDSADAAATKANEAANNANTAAYNANKQATNANTKASYAQQQGDYAKTQGDYAKEQGDYAKAQGDYVKEQGDVAKSAANSVNAAATKANEAANNANTAAYNANKQATNANTKASYAQQQGDYAKAQGDAAKLAANSANTAATNANNAATAANAAAANAQSVADNTKYIEEYNPNTRYQKNNIVTYKGSSFIAKTATLGHTPVGDSSDPYWALLAKKGADGKGSVSTVNNVYPDNNGNVELTPADIGAETPLNAQKKADQAKQNAKAYFDSQKGVPNGIATLGPDGKVPASQFPNASTTQAGIVQLDDTLTSTSTTQAATANAVKRVNDAVVAHSADTTKHVTQAEKDAWNSAEQNAKNFVLQAKPNLLKNSSFQFGLAGWANTCSHFAVGQTLNLGSFVDHWGSVPADEWHMLESTQRIPCWNGGIYVTMSAWFYSFGQTHGNIFMELYGNGSPRILGQLRADLNKDWHRKADNFYIPSGTTEIWVKFIVGGDPVGMPQGSKAVTRIKLEYGTQATPYSEEANFLYVSDGKAQLESTITAKGGTVTKAGAVPTFAELNSGINSIPVGKKWASGSTYVDGSTYEFMLSTGGLPQRYPRLYVTGLSFKARYIIAYTPSVGGYYDRITYNADIAHTYRTIIAANDVRPVIVQEANSLIVDNTSFSLPVPKGYITYNWIAFE